MKKRLIALLILSALALTLFAACESDTKKVLTQEDAMAVALEAAGISADEAEDVHAHITEENGIPCYSIHISVGDTTYSYVIAANGGEILSSGVE